MSTVQTLSEYPFDLHETNYLGSDSHTVAYRLIGKSRTGQAVPGWRDLINKGLDATSPFSAFEATIESVSPFTFRVTRESDVSNWIQTSGIGGGLYLAYAPDAVDLQLESTNKVAVEKAWADIASSFNALTTLGELRETLGMLRQPLNSLRTGINRYLSSARRHRDKAKRRKITKKDALDAISNTYLEYAFGWRPLMRDISSIGEAYNRILHKEHVTHFGSGHSVFFNDTRDYPPYLPFAGQNLGYIAVPKQVQQCRVSTRIKGAYRMEINSPAMYELGISFPEFVPTFWNLIPGTFVVDYFTNIGAVLDAWASAQLTNMVYTSRTTNVLTQSASALVLEPYGPLTEWRLQTNESGLLSSTLKQVNRSAIDLPVPSFSRRQFNGGSKYLNLAALIVALTRDRSFKF